MSEASAQRQIPPKEGVAEAIARALHMNRQELGKRVFAYLALLPILAIYLVLRVFPIFQNFIYSFYNSTVVNPRANFAGLDNYLNLFDDRLFLISLRNTTVFAVFVTLLSVVFALGLAVLLANRPPLGGLYEAALSDFP